MSRHIMPLLMLALASAGSAPPLDAETIAPPGSDGPLWTPERDPSLAGRSSSNRAPVSGGGRKRRKVKRQKRGGQR